MSTIILGSQSPRRKEILQFFSIPFTQISPDFDEDSVPFEGDPAKYVCAISGGKAASLAKSYPEEIILTADTTVYCNGQVYGKPKDREEARKFLTQLAGKWHSVFTGVTVQNGNKISFKAEETKVLFNALSPAQIEQYLLHATWADKAGGYAIQAGGGLLVSKIDGCYYNVMGLPINTAALLLEQFQVNLWLHLGK